MNKLFKYRRFDDHLIALARRGGKFSKAADSVYALLGRASTMEDPFEKLKLTGHGESRIKKCRKYDLTGAARLVTASYGNATILLFVGDHEACDNWLNQNRGREFTVNGSNQIESTIVDVHRPDIQPGMSPLTSAGPLLTRLDNDLPDRLLSGIPYSLLSEINAIGAASSADDINQFVQKIDDPAQCSAVSDVLLLLLDGNIVDANGRARLYVEDVVTLSEHPDIDIPDYVDSDFVKSISSDHPDYHKVYRQFAVNADYRSWMTFMHPDQEKIVKHSFSGAAKLLGVSGSGKTCVVVRRAIELAERYPEERILVLTLNEPLAKLVESLVDACALPDSRQRIDVRAFFEICRSMLLEFEPDMDRHYRSVTWKGEEHIDEIWLEYYQCEANNHDAEVLFPVHDTLISQGYRADRYLRDEMDWIRSACIPTKRSNYVAMQRKGRVVPLAREYRQRILKGLEGWEKKMTFVGGSDVLYAASALIRHHEKIKPLYRCILVDECQDFGNVELSVVRSLAAEAEDDLFLCGDAAQQVSSRYQSLRNVGIEIPPGRSKKLFKNYRNSKDILRAAHEVLTNNMDQNLLERDDFEVLDPEYSVFEGNLPLLLRAQSPGDELGCALTHAHDYVSEHEGSIACIAIAGHSLYEVEQWAKLVKLPVLNGRQGIDTGSVYLSDLEQTKGFEFDLMCIVNCRSDFFPRKGDPDSESFRDLSRLYVAMTRAKLELILSYCSEPSPFLCGVGEYIGAGSWEDYIDEPRTEYQNISSPAMLEDLREEGLGTIPVAKMTGAQFLYTFAAVGLSSELTGKIRELVDVVGLRRNSDRVRWRNMGDAAHDYRSSPVSRRQWGTVVGKQFSEIILKLSL